MADKSVCMILGGLQCLLGLACVHVFLNLCFLILTFSPETNGCFLNDIWNFINFMSTDDPRSTVCLCVCACSREDTDRTVNIFGYTKIID